MKKLIICILFSILAQAEDFVIEVGQSLSRPLSGSRVWVEKSTVIKAEARGGKVLITGKHNGESLIRIGSVVSTIQVIDHERASLYEFLKMQIKKSPGLSVQLSQGEVEVQGYLHSWEIWKNLLTDRNFGSNYLMRARLSVSLQVNIQKLIDQDLSEAGLLSINLSKEPHFHVRLHPDQQGLDLYQRYFQKLGIPVVLLKESLMMEPSVRVQITVAEVSKKYSRNLGINWFDAEKTSGQARFDILPEGLVSSETLHAKLTALEIEGHANLLASPNLICRSGKEAEFMAGGEFPIRIKTSHQFTVIWKRYGVLLKIKPLADSSGKMSLTIESEISSLGPLMDEIPMIETNKVSSHFDISHSQVIALSGLLRDDNSKGHKGLPWLSKLPVLGPLFASHDYITEKTELVIFVRPSLINHGEKSVENNNPEHVGKLDGNSINLQ